MNKLFVFALWLFVSVACHAVTLSPAGMGQVLIFPYYTTRSLPDGTAFNTLLSITNSTFTGNDVRDAKAIRIRVLEARAGAPLFEINVFLGPTDIWTAA